MRAEGERVGGYASGTNPQQPERQSIEPTYDHRETGDRFRIDTHLNGRLLSSTSLVDPFVRQRIVVGWRDLLRGLLRRRLEVVVRVSADLEMVEDVSELNADYLGLARSSRRREWNAQLQRGIGDFAARLAEHEPDPTTAQPPLARDPEWPDLPQEC